MTSSSTPTPPRTATIGKNQFRCFQCRGVFPKKDGQWVNWEQMQAMLCASCDKATAKAPERSR